jgi:hypothetical protein
LSYYVPRAIYNESPHLRFLWEAVDCNTKLMETLNGGNLTVNELAILEM